MKLIDLLVQELPKRGGWPEGVYVIEQSYRGNLFNASKPSEPFLFDSEKFEMVDAWREARVTRKQYEAALQQPVWDGIGLPPVGCECELSNAVEFYTHSGSTDFDEGTPVVVGGTVNFGLGDFVAVKVKGTNCITDINPCFLRPIRSEADKKRDDAIAKITDAICGEIADTGWATAEKYAARAYDAIARGDIPGIKLSD